MLGERLKRARLRSGLSLEALAQKANGIVSKQAISQYEKNQKNPSSTVLIALANALDVGVEYFFRTTQVSIEKVDFRKHSAFSKKKQEMIKERVREYLERYIQIEDILEISKPFENPIKNSKIEKFDDIEDIVTRLRDSWGLGIDPIANVVEMLELRDIKVIFVNDEKKFNGLSGFANGNEAHPFIVLNNNKELSSDRKRFTALHELGHLLLPKHSLDEEKASDRFAGAFLFPKESVIKEFGNKRNKIAISELNHIKQKYGISIAGIIFRLRQLNIISEAMFKRFWIQNRSVKFDEEFPLEIEEKALRFENLLAHAYSEQLISLSKLSELAGVGVDEALQKYAEAV